MVVLDEMILFVAVLFDDVDSLLTCPAGAVDEPLVALLIEAAADGFDCTTLAEAALLLVDDSVLIGVFPAK